MVFPKARLAVSAALFLAWIGFLVYLVVRTRNPVILSRPQLVVSSAVVIADVIEKDGRPSPMVTIQKLVWTLSEKDAMAAGAQLTVEGLADCRREQGWSGPGEYILPLTKRADGAYEVTPLPLSPGYMPAFVTIELVRVGPEKAKVAEVLAKLWAGEIAPGMRWRNVPRADAEEIKRKLDAAAAGVRITEGESRIYRDTPDALAQLKEIEGRR
jgi:hypothetical protein